MTDSNSTDRSSSDRNQPIAVVGVSALFPESIDRNAFWQNILEGRDLISDVPSSHWLIEDYYDPDPSAPDKTYAKRGGFLPDVAFDPLHWGVPPTIVPATDTNQLLALIVAERVLSDASRKSAVDKERASVILGVTSAQELLGSMVSRLQRPFWVRGLRAAGLPEDEVQAACERISEGYVDWQESTFPGVLGNVVAGRIANRLDLHGTNCVTDAACASTFSALAMAVYELQLGHSDFVIAGGADTMNDIFMYMCFSKTPALSRTGDCRPFSDNADGTMLGEGIGMVALKRLSDAERDGDEVYAVIRAVGSSSDGRSKSVYAPVPEGQARALDRAYEIAGYSPRTVELVEAHGTGTIAGDAAEFAGLRQAFGEDTSPWCALGSVKSQVGHTKSAAGAAGLFKAVMALHHKVLPPTIKIEQPNPKLGIEESPFYLPQKARPWLRDGSHPRRASVSSFGFGGSNFHVALEEYSGKQRPGRVRTLPTELLVLSAASGEELAQKADALAASITDISALRFAAYSGHDTFEHNAPARLALVVENEADAKSKLSDAAERLRGGATSVDAPNGVYFRVGAAAEPVAFLFPGQGSQYVGMGSDLANAFDDALDVWQATLTPALDGVADKVFPRAEFDDGAAKRHEAALRATDTAQPAIGAASAATFAILKRAGVEPAYVAGHSFGELTALYAADAYDLGTFLSVAADRGAVMAEAAKAEGTMAAVSATKDKVVELIEGSGATVVVANHNAPKQVVVSGPVADVETFEAYAKSQKVRCTRLSVATAFHSPVVAGATSAFEKRLAARDVAAPKVPVFANATAAPYEKDVKGPLRDQLASPVRFVESVEAMHAAGARVFVEVGPGSVLTGLVSRILKGKDFTSISTDRKGRHGVTGLQRALGQLAALGHPVAQASLFHGYAVPQDPAALPKPRMTMLLNGSNYGKPYPPKDGAAGRLPPNPPRAEGQSPAALHVAPVREDESWLSAFDRMQQETLSAHAAFQQTLANSHSEFLQASQVAMHSIASLTGATPPPLQRIQASAAPSPAAPVVAPVTGVSAPPPVAAPAPVAATPPSPATPPAASPSGATGITPAALTAVLREVIADKTGYPEEMVGEEMDLEADLGVDSIKRVEILAAVRKRLPSLPDAPPSELGALRSVAEIASRLGDANAVANARPEAVTRTMQAVDVSALSAPRLTSIDALSPAAAEAPSAAASGADAPVDVSAMIAIIADKTGYPPDMIEPENDLEADLGVDSIKRVEILAEMRRRAPQLPDVPPSELGALRTIAEIAARLGISTTPGQPQENVAEAQASTALSKTPTAPAPSTTAVTVAPPPSAAAEMMGTLAVPADLEALMREVVADKTGYPPDMIEPDMDLEADLGVDSIKRVEILSAIRKRAPQLPDVPASELGALRTLGEIAARLGAAGQGGSAPTATTAAETASSPASVAPTMMPPASTSAAQASAPVVDAAAAETSSTSSDLVQALIAVVAEKTGYPADMVEPAMDLEADLGVDSIKRVEILSAMRARRPDLPDVPPSELAPLRTIDAIAEMLQGGAPVAAATTAALDAPSESAGVVVRALRMKAAARPAVQTPGLFDTKVRVMGGEAPLRRAVAKALKVAGVDVVEKGGAGIISLHGLTDVVSVDEALSVQRAVFTLCRQAAGDLSNGLLVVAADLGGDLALGGSPRGWLAGLSALTKTAGREWPEACARFVDLERGTRDDASLARELVQELLLGGLDAEVALSAEGSRQVLEEFDAPEGQARSIGERPVCVVSGGARGVTAACVIEFAKRTKGRFALLGRSPLEEETEATLSAKTDPELKRALLDAAKARGEKLTPKTLGAAANRVARSREVRATLEAITSAGGEAKYISVDVTDAAAVQSACASVRSEWGAISVLVHGAGVLADKFIADKTDEQFDRVWDTKVTGFRNLLRATKQDTLSALACFSSVAGRYGNAGQVDYAMANAVLARVCAAEAQRRPDARVVSFDWGPWAGGMVDEGLAKHFEAQGVGLIPIDRGAQLFAEGLLSDGPAEVVIGAGFPAGEARSTLRFVVSKKTMPQLADHAVNGRVVLPVVVAARFLLDAAFATGRATEGAALEQLRVMSGVTIPDFSTPTALDVVFGDDGVVELRSAGSKLHYRAKLSTASSATRFEVPASLRAFDGAVYGGVLFHGTAFRVLDQVSRLDVDGAQAQVAPGRVLGWDTGSRIDAASLDGGLQLALLWAERALGGATLPTSVDRLVVHRQSVGLLTCLLKANSVSALEAECDIIFTEGEDVVAEMLGVTVTALPSTSTQQRADA